MKYATFPVVDRVTIVTTEGVEYEGYHIYENGVEAHLQDDGRTLKIFPLGSEPHDDTQARASLSWKTGGLLGSFMRLGMEAKPVLDDEGNYLNQIIVDLGPPFGEVLVRVEVPE